MQRHRGVKAEETSKSVIKAGTRAPTGKWLEVRWERCEVCLYTKLNCLDLVL